MAHDAIEGLLPPRRGEIFLHRHRVHIACAAPVEVTSGGMMDGVIVLPVIVRCKVQEAGDPADEIISFLRFEERAVSTIVEDDKGPHHKSGGRDR